MAAKVIKKIKMKDEKKNIFAIFAGRLALKQ
jgi:hypothetical protein